jgi:hypothetical protein
MKTYYKNKQEWYSENGNNFDFIGVHKLTIAMVGADNNMYVPKRYGLSAPTVLCNGSRPDWEDAVYTRKVDAVMAANEIGLRHGLPVVDCQ